MLKGVMCTCTFSKGICPVDFHQEYLCLQFVSGFSVGRWGLGGLDDLSHDGHVLGCGGDGLVLILLERFVCGLELGDGVLEGLLGGITGGGTFINHLKIRTHQAHMGATSKQAKGHHIDTLKLAQSRKSDTKKEQVGGTEGCAKLSGPKRRMNGEQGGQQ